MFALKSNPFLLFNALFYCLEGLIIPIESYVDVYFR